MTNNTRLYDNFSTRCFLNPCINFLNICKGLEIISINYDIMKGNKVSYRKQSALKDVQL